MKQFGPLGSIRWEISGVTQIKQKSETKTPGGTPKNFFFGGGGGMLACRTGVIFLRFSSDRGAQVTRDRMGKAVLQARAKFSDKVETKRCNFPIPVFRPGVRFSKLHKSLFYVHNVHYQKIRRLMISLKAKALKTLQCLETHRALRAITKREKKGFEKFLSGRKALREFEKKKKKKPTHGLLMVSRLSL